MGEGEETENPNAIGVTRELAERCQERQEQAQKEDKRGSDAEGDTEGTGVTAAAATREEQCRLSQERESLRASSTQLKSYASWPRTRISHRR